MTPLQNLHYAIGELAYAIAFSDGNIQKDERKKFTDMVAAELRCKEYDFEISDIIFRLLEKDKSSSPETCYAWAMKEIRLNGHYLSPELKKTFIKFIEKVAKAYSPVTNEEQRIINNFKKDIAAINGDPVYYQPKKILKTI